MTFINYDSCEINCKIAYCGPRLCGKVENLLFIHEKTKPGDRGELISLPTEADHTLFFDFFPHELGHIRGIRTRLHLYTVPDQLFYEAARTLILKGVDGIVFVADSRRERIGANVMSLCNLEHNLKTQGHDIRSVPFVLQLNKRDYPDAVPAVTMRSLLAVKDAPVIEAIAHAGIGVFDTLNTVATLVFEDLARVRRESVARDEGGVGAAIA